MFWYGHGMGSWAGGLMIIGNLLFWTAVIFGIVVLVRLVGRSSHPRTTKTSAAEQLLAERFARGEINEQEYWSRLETLRGVRPPTDDSASRDGTRRDS